MLLAVVYHYVSAEPAAESRATFPISSAQLAAQVEELSRGFEVVSRDHLLAAAAGERSLPERACLLTFDDGLRCQIEIALPVLERLGAPAVFFVPGKPLAERRPLVVHMVHAVRERIDDARLLELLAAHGVSPDHVSREDATAHYRYDEAEAARVKYLLNVAVPPAERQRVVSSIFSQLVGDEAAFAAELYASSDQVRDLERAHRAVGAHSYAHQPLAKLTPRALDDDLARVRGVLAGLTGSPPLAFSYPYGGPAAVSTRVARRVEAAGFRVAFTMERATNETLAEPLLLARIDANDAPGGKKPLLDERATVA